MARAYTMDKMGRIPLREGRVLLLINIGVLELY